MVAIEERTVGDVEAAWRLIIQHSALHKFRTIVFSEKMSTECQHSVLTSDVRKQKSLKLEGKNE